MTRSFDELYPPRAMTLDELFAAIQPPPLLPVGYDPSASTAPGVQPTPLTPLNYPDTLRNRSNDAGLDPSDDWQKRGRETAAMALSILYPKEGLIPVAANGQSNFDATGLSPWPIAAPAIPQLRADPRVPDEFNATISGGVANDRDPKYRATQDSVRGTSVDPDKPYFPHWTPQIPREGELGLWRADEPYSWIDENAGQIKNVPRGGAILDRNLGGQPGHFQKNTDDPSGNRWKYRLMPWLGV